MTWRIEHCSLPLPTVLLNHLTQSTARFAVQNTVESIGRATLPDTGGRSMVTGNNSIHVWRTLVLTYSNDRMHV
ncbi:hypothetical protein PSPO01_08178 [Paraphaeosphaeria sporulosa]